jgi:hypothetical protein
MMFRNHLILIYRSHPISLTQPGLNLFLEFDVNSTVDIYNNNEVALDFSGSVSGRLCVWQEGNKNDKAEGLPSRGSLHLPDQDSVGCWHIASRPQLSVLLVLSSKGGEISS